MKEHSAHTVGKCKETVRLETSLIYAEELIFRKQFVENMYNVRNRHRPQCYRISSMRAFFLSTPIIQMQDLL
jgi:hypothetical protein